MQADEEVGVKTRHGARKHATCTVTLSCGRRVGEGSVVDLTVPDRQLETALLLES